LVHAVALFKYAETHVTDELVRVSKLVTAAWRDASPESSKSGVRHSLRDGPTLIGACDATCVEGALREVEAEAIDVGAARRVRRIAPIPRAIVAHLRDLGVSLRKESARGLIGASLHTLNLRAAVTVAGGTFGVHLINVAASK
jgi:hypothetical protein